jgi:PHP family Zn ribbon phosphoesterase
LSPNLETAEQINDKLRVHGDLSIDGRPTLKMSASELVEEVMETSKENAVIPAHVWTPWYSLFGSINGFARIEDCYEDATRHIFALETGLSSDPPMNWRLSKLDRLP